MLIPRFTIRTILAIMALCAVLFVMVGTAFRGQLWGWGIVIGVLSVGLTLLVHAAFFQLASWFARRAAKREDAA
jgi:hypothetical protein